MNVVDLMTLQSRSNIRMGSLMTISTSYLRLNKPVIFAYHGYPWADLTGSRTAGGTTLISTSVW